MSGNASEWEGHTHPFRHCSRMTIRRLWEAEIVVAGCGLRKERSGRRECCAKKVRMCAPLDI